MCSDPPIPPWKSWKTFSRPPG